MIIRPGKNNYDKHWDQFCDMQDWSPPEYTINGQIYQSKIYETEGKKTVNQSFIVEKNNKQILAFCGVKFLDKSKSHLTTYRLPCISLENSNEINDESKKEFINEFEKISKLIKGKIWYRDFLVNGKLSLLSHHLLTKKIKISLFFTQVINLNLEKKFLWNDIRKSYKSLINWGLREMEFKIFDSNSIDWTTMIHFRNLHIKVSGRETRTIESWKKQYEWIKKNNAFVIFSYFKKKLVSAGFFSFSKNNCSYGISASNRELFSKPIFHAVMWKAIIYSKSIGCKWFDSGEQIFKNIIPNSQFTEKELNISFFKAGFGGKIQTFLDFTINILVNEK